MNRPLNSPQIKPRQPLPVKLLGSQSEQRLSATETEMFVRPRVTVASYDVAEDDTSDTHTHSSLGDDDSYISQGMTTGGRASNNANDNSSSAENEDSVLSPSNNLTAAGAALAARHKRQRRSRAVSPYSPDSRISTICHSAHASGIAQQQQPDKIASANTLIAGESSRLLVASRRRHGASSSVPRALVAAAGRLTAQTSNLALHSNNNKTHTTHKLPTTANSKTKPTASSMPHQHISRDNNVSIRKRRGGGNSAAAVIEQQIAKPKLQQRKKNAKPTPPRPTGGDVQKQVAALTPLLAGAVVTSQPSPLHAKDAVDLSCGSGLFTLNSANGEIVSKRMPAVLDATSANDFASEMFGIQLRIVTQPEAYHRARYQKEGSRGCIKSQNGSGDDFPSIELLGCEKADEFGFVIVQAYLCGDDIAHGIVPNALYKACKVGGGGKQPHTGGNWYEKRLNGTPLLECELNSNQKSTQLDCLGVMKVRNADLEQQKSEISIEESPLTTSRAASTKRAGAQHATAAAAAKTRIVFRVIMKVSQKRFLEFVAESKTLKPDAQEKSAGETETFLILHAISSTITCTSSPGMPEIHRISHEHIPVSGNLDLFIIGKNFVKDDSCVLICEPFDDDNFSNKDSKPICFDARGSGSWAWQTEAPINKDFFQSTHLIVRMPPYAGTRNLNNEATCKMVLFVRNKSSNMESEPHAFYYYTPSEQNVLPILPQITTPTTNSLKTKRLHSYSGGRRKSGDVAATAARSSVVVRRISSCNETTSSIRPASADHDDRSSGDDDDDHSHTLAKSSRFLSTNQVNSNIAAIISPTFLSPSTAATSSSRRHVRRATAPHVYYPCAAPANDEIVKREQIPVFSSFPDSGGNFVAFQQQQTMMMPQQQQQHRMISLSRSNPISDGGCAVPPPSLGLLQTTTPNSSDPTKARRASVSHQTLFSGGCIVEELSAPPPNASFISCPLPALENLHVSPTRATTTRSTSNQSISHHLSQLTAVSPPQHTTLPASGIGGSSSSSSAFYSAHSYVPAHHHHHHIRHHPYSPLVAAAAAAAAGGVSALHGLPHVVHDNNNYVPSHAAVSGPTYLLQQQQEQQQLPYPIFSSVVNTHTNPSTAAALDRTEAPTEHGNCLSSYFYDDNFSNSQSFLPPHDADQLQNSPAQQQQQHQQQNAAADAFLSLSELSLTPTQTQQQQQQENEILLDALDDLLNDAFATNASIFDTYDDGTSPVLLPNADRGGFS